MHLFIRYTPVCAVIAMLKAWCVATPRAFSQSPPTHERAARDVFGKNDSGLKLPAGFCATVFADGIGHARHLVVAPDGVVYVNTWSGRYDRGIGHPTHRAVSSHAGNSVNSASTATTRLQPKAFARKTAWSKCDVSIC
jgi:glucose/arabinose dehydrogenase